MVSSSSNTILGTMEWAKKLNFGRRSALGNSLQPALTSADTILQTIIGPPFAWRWNRVVTGFITTPGQQDYTLVNWQSGMTVKAKWLTVDDDGNSQVCTTAGQVGTVLPSWNHTKNGTTTDNTVVWTNLGSLGVAVSSTYNLGFIETVSVQDTVSQKWVEITTSLCLASDSSESRPRYISAQGDDGFGATTFRLMPTPDLAYPVAITLQQKAPTLKGVGGAHTWAPIPDEYARIYNWGFLSMMWLFADDPRFGIANQKFISQLLSTAEGLTETQRNIFLQGWQQQTGQPVTNMDRLQQGFQARGI